MKSFKLYLADGKVMQSDKTLIMGILNPTPDSFSDGGELADQSTLEQRIKSMIKAGADILDVGGESTRPGHQKVSSGEEIKRILPAIRTIRRISRSIPISVDTRKSAVAETAIKAGASFINDVSALSDDNMASTAKKAGCSIILMRNRSTGKDVISGCRRQFEKILAETAVQGIEQDRILLDPGLGFGDLAGGNYRTLPGSDMNANLLLILSIDRYSLGCPVVIGASRKRFIGEWSGVKQANKRIAGSVAAAVMAAESGAAIVRVHDVAETARAIRTI
ncbi:MAG TPA: dihydropteroate synthase [Candidatus Saccharimonadales bacterium]|nr:dihydropteroate synthase [Candidatus Saccharimonadales bacterium]